MHIILNIVANTKVNDDYSSFNATWRWPTDRFNVHSYPHVKFKSEYLPLQLSDLANLTLRATWDVSATTQDLASTGISSNIAWDIFADADANSAGSAAKAHYEIMIWMGSYGNPYPFGYQDGPHLNKTIQGITL